MQYQKPLKKFKPQRDPWEVAMEKNRERYEDMKAIGRAIRNHR